MKLFQSIAGGLVILLIIDLMGFVAWTTSNQKPIDGFYIGAITANIIKIIK